MWGSSTEHKKNAGKVIQCDTVMLGFGLRGVWGGGGEVSGVKNFCLEEHGTLAVGPVETSETWRAMARLGFGVACCYVWTSTWKCAFVYVSRVMEETGAYTVAVLDDLWTRLILQPWWAEKKK